MFKSIIQWSIVFLAPVGFISIVTYIFDPFTTGDTWVYKKVKHIEEYANVKIKQGYSGRSCEKIDINSIIHYPKNYKECFKDMKLQKISYTNHRTYIKDGKKTTVPANYIYGVYRCEMGGVITEMRINPYGTGTNCSVTTFSKSDNIPIGEAYKHNKDYK